MENKTWREHCSPIIHKVLTENKDKPEAEIKKALFDAYPFGERKYHPYKIWLSEIRNQRKVRKKIKNLPNQVLLNL